MCQIKYIREMSIGLLVLVSLLLVYWGGIRESDEYSDEEDAVSLESLLSDTSKPIEDEEIDGDDKKQSQEESVLEGINVVVDVKGAVKFPGVFSLDTDQRVIDAIEAAGGLTENADTKYINFAQLLVDEMYVYIPEVGEDTTQMTDITEKHMSKESVVDINKAEEAELVQLDGIGPSKAAEIVKYRDENGPFKSVEELINVSGIGEKTYERIKEVIKAN